MVTANIATIVGLSLVAAALIAVFFSPYRRWLSFMGAGRVLGSCLIVLRRACWMKALARPWWISFLSITPRVF